jgi:ATP-dependent protease ClpP protease subunit
MARSGVSCPTLKTPEALEARLENHDGHRLAVVNLYGDIGSHKGFRARDFRTALAELGNYDTLYALLDSPGGSVFEAWSVYEYLTAGPAGAHPSLVLISGQCSGEAILVALGFKHILMRPGSWVQFNSSKLVSIIAGGHATGVISRLIASRIGCEVADVRGWMDKSRKFTADECLECHLCDAII